MPAWLQDWMSGAALAVTTAVMAWLVRLGGRVTGHETRLSIVEKQIENMPALLESIRDEIKGLRADESVARKELYKHIEGLRKELKDDLRHKADKD